jgi:hypothetical protein
MIRSTYSVWKKSFAKGPGDRGQKICGFAVWDDALLCPNERGKGKWRRFAWKVGRSIKTFIVKLTPV